MKTGSKEGATGNQFQERRIKLDQRKTDFVQAVSHYYLMRGLITRANNNGSFTEDTYPDIFGKVAFGITQDEKRLAEEIEEWKED
jgi:hypothetical protein